MNYELLAKEIQRCFGETFLPKDFVKCWVSDGKLNLKIGDRDGEFEPDGKNTSSGSNVGSGVEWRIEKDDSDNNPS